jgi:hypothetical protein
MSPTGAAPSSRISVPPARTAEGPGAIIAEVGA